MSFATMQPPSPKTFSVITVCRNAAATILEAGRSLRQQTYSNYEWLVVDGASTDDTCALARECLRAEDRLISEPDHGIYDAMNKGLSIATGQFVYFLNADDVLANSDVLARVSAELSDNIRLLYGNVVLWDPEEGMSGRVGQRFSYVDALTCRLPHHQASFVSRKWMDESGGFDLRFGLSCDIHLLGRALVDPARCKHISCDIARFRTGGASYRAPVDLHVLSDRTRAIAAAFGFWPGLFHRIFLVYFIPKMLALKSIRGTAIDRIWRKRRMRAQGLSSP